jgi:amidase
LDYTQFLNRDGLKGVRIGVMRQHAGFHDEVDTVFNRAIDTLRARGAAPSPT